MLGYADYVFTAVFAFEIGLKVTGSTAVCLRGLLLHVTHSKAAWSAFDDFSFLSSVIKLTLFSFLSQRIFFLRLFNLFLLFLFNLWCMEELLWLHDSDWKLFCSFLYVLWNMSTDNRYITVWTFFHPSWHQSQGESIYPMKGMYRFSFLWLNYVSGA